jgi:hypothetical protein
MKKTMRPNWLTDDEVEKEIAELQSSEFVKLARKEERIRVQRRQYLYTLRQYEKKGKALAEAGITMEALQAIANGEEE